MSTGNRSVPTGKSNHAQLILTEIVNELNGVGGKPGRRAVRFSELEAAGIISTNEKGLIRSGQTLEAMNLKVAGIEGKVEGFTRGVDLLKSTIENTNGELVLQTQQLTALRSNLKVLQGEGENTKVALEANSEAQRALLSRISASEDRVEALSQATINLQSTVTVAEGSMSFIHEGVIANAEANQLLEARVTVAEGLIDAHAQFITDLQADVSTLQGDVIAQGNAIDTLETRVTVTEGDITSVSNRTTTLENTVNHPTTGVAANAAAVSSLDSRVDATEASITAHASDISKLEVGLYTASELLNPSFEYVGDWSSSILESGFDANTLPTGVAYSTESFYRGKQSMKFSPDAATSRAIYNRALHGVSPGQKIRASINFRTNGAGAQPQAGVQVRIGFRFTDQNDANPVNGFGPSTVLDGVTPIQYETNGRLEYEFTVPAGMYNARFFFHQHSAAVNQGALYFDNAEVSFESLQDKANASAVSALDTRVTSAEGTITSQATSLTKLDASIAGLQSTTVAIANPSFEYQGDWGNAPDNYTDLPEGFSYYGTGGSSAYKYSGQWSMWIVANASGARSMYNRAQFPVLGGQAVPVSMRVRTVAGAQPNAGSGVRLSCRWYDATGAFLSNTHSPLVASDGATTINFTTGYMEFTHIAPVGAVLGQFFIQQVNAMGQGGFMVDDLRAQLPTIQGNANATAISALDARVTSAEGSISANATSITSLNASVGSNSASISTIQQVQAADVEVMEPSFENDGGWGNNTASVALPPDTLYQTDSGSSDYVHSGHRSLRFNANAATRTVYNQRYIRVIPGQKIRVRFWFRNWLGASPNGSYVRATAYQQDDAGAFVSHAANVAGAQYTFTGVNVGVWTEVVGLYTVPAGVGRVYFAIQCVGMTANAVLVDDYTIEAVTSDVMAMWAVNLDVNGRASGFKSINDGETSSFIINADKFEVYGTGDTLRWQAGVITSEKGSNAVKVGAGFGADASGQKLIFYFGPSGADTSRTLALSTVGINEAGKIKLAGANTNLTAGWDSGADATGTYNTASPATVTFNVTAGVFRSSGVAISYNAGSGTASQARSTTVVYHLYYIDPGMAGGTKTLGISTDYRKAFDNPDNVYIGKVSVTIPASGSGTGGTKPPNECVSVDAFVLRRNAEGEQEAVRAGDIEVGDYLALVDGGWGRVSYSEPAFERVVRLVANSGHTLTCSRTAPLRKAGGGHVLAPEACGHAIDCLYPVPVLCARIVKVEELDEEWVQHITCENDDFWAGDDKDHMFAHHNLKF